MKVTVNKYDLSCQMRKVERIISEEDRGGDGKRRWEEEIDIV